MMYRRTVDPSGQDSLAKLARWITPGSTVLELGAAAGYFTAHLASLGCTVDVIEIDPEAAREAARHARRSVVADLDGEAWVLQLGEARYDAIVCADVLEHLRNGPALLRRLRGLLADGGALLLSVPNVAHSAIIAALVDERFDYGGEGLLDSTHVHLYTWRSLARTLHDAGFRVATWDATTLPTFDTEFRVRLETLAPGLRDVLAERPHALVYQWLAKAVPGPAQEPLPPPATDGTASVPIRLLLAANEDSLSLDDALVQRLSVGGTAVAFEWSWPAGPQGLRLMLADRPGVVEVRSLDLFAGESRLWTFGGDTAALRLAEDVVPVGGDRFALLAADGWLAPDVPAELLARANRLVATLAWPAGVAASGEHGVLDALGAALLHERDAWTHRREELVAMIEARDQQLAALRDEQARMASRLAQAQQSCADLEQSTAADRAEQERLERALHAQERIIDYRQSGTWWLKLPFVRLRLALRRLRWS